MTRADLRISPLARTSSRRTDGRREIRKSPRTQGTCVRCIQQQLRSRAVLLQGHRVLITDRAEIRTRITRDGQPRLHRLGPDAQCPSVTCARMRRRRSTARTRFTNRRLEGVRQLNGFRAEADNGDVRHSTDSFIDRLFRNKAQRTVMYLSVGILRELRPFTRSTGRPDSMDAS